MKIKKNSRLYYKYLFSYLFLLLIPLLIIAGFIYSYFFSALKTQELENNLNVLDRAKNVIETQVNQLDKISTQLYANNRLKFYYFEKEPLEAIVIKNELKNFIAMNPFISDIVYYQRSERTLITSNSPSSVEMFIGSIYTYENWTLDDFFNDINKINTPTFRPSEVVTVAGEGEKKFITYIYPVKTNGIDYDKTVMFMMPEKSFSSLLENITYKTDGISAIFDKSGQTIVSIGDATFLDSNELKDISTCDITGRYNETINIQNKKYLLSYVCSSDTGWKYITLIPVSTVMGKINTIQVTMFGVLIAVLLIGLAIIGVSMRLNFQPIKKLRQITQGYLTDENQSVNELEDVKNAFEFLNNQNTKLQTELEVNSFAAKDYLLSKLISGQILDIDELNEKGKGTGIQFNYSAFRVVVFLVAENQKSNISDIIQMLESSLPENITGYAKSKIEQNNIIMILCYDKINEDCVTNYLRDVHLAISGEFGVNNTLGIGISYEGICNIPKSYMEAVAALDYRLVLGINRIIFFNEIGIDKSLLGETSNYKLERLRVYIKHGDFKQVEAMLDEFLVKLQSKNTPIIVARILCYDIISIVTKIIDELSQEQLIANELYPDVFRLTKFETAEELVQIVRKISYEIIEFISKKESSTEAIDAMKEYISSNYCDCDFSVQKMADGFQLSLPSLSQYFKEQTKVNVLDYVTNLRIDKAKYLLLSTELPVKDIALSTGYYNVNSFSRRFKQITGLTPIEYRKYVDEDL